MRKLLLALFALLFSALSLFAQIRVPGPGGFKQSGAATWTLVHNTFCSSLTCPGGTLLNSAATTFTIAVPSTTAGNKVTLWVATANTSAQRTISSVTGGETFTFPGGCAGFISSAGSVACGYVLSATGGATSLVVTLSGASAIYVAFWIAEWSSTSPASFDNSNNVQITSCLTCAAPTLSISGTNDLITQIGLPAQSYTAISGAYTSDFTDSLGRAWLLGASSYTVPNWTQDISANVSNGVLALKQ
jgi:hypothetical protein